MVISSPCLIDNKELTSPEQTALGKDFSNPLIVNYMVINVPRCYNEALASPKQTAIGKDFLNPLIVDSLLK
ncbi:hypothetical protein Tco_0049097, partial [Tanacetum coccineum]